MLAEYPPDFVLNDAKATAHRNFQPGGNPVNSWRRRIYAFPKLGGREFGGFRIGGGGLGNLLFPFARCAIASRRYGLVRINPTWRSLHVGPLLRREYDSRFYGDLFHDTFGVTGAGKSLILGLSRRIDEMGLTSITGDSNSWRPRVVVFEGLGRFFEDILLDYEMVRDEIFAVSRLEHTAHLPDLRRDSIGVHVRLGDFSAAPIDGARMIPHSNARVPLVWYLRIIRAIRECAGKDIPVDLYSDGSDEELRELLALKNVRRRFYKSALADMLALSRCGILIGSSGSTFSMWASYLGRMPSIWYPREAAVRLYSEGESFEGELSSGESLPERLRADVKALVRLSSVGKKDRSCAE